MKTPEQIEAELSNAASKEDLHKELHAQTKQFVTWFATWMGLSTVLILGFTYFSMSDVKNDIRDVKNDLREIRNRLPAQSK